MSIETQPIKDYGFAKPHDKRSVRMYDFIGRLDFINGAGLDLKSGGDGDNGEMLMDLLDAYWKDFDEEMDKCDT